MTYKETIELLLKPGYYLRQLPGTAKRFKFRLYKGRQNLISHIPGYYYWRLRDVLKKDADGRYTLSRRLIQAQHGSRVVKRIYKKSIAKK